MNKYFPLAIITITEASIGLFVKLSEGIPIFSLNFYRVLFAFVFLLITMPLIHKKFWEVKKKDIKPTLIMGFLIALQISLFNIAMTLAPIANVVILWSIYPFFVFIFSVIFLDEKISNIHIFLFLVALFGIFIAKPFTSGYFLGNIISLIGGVVFACLISYMRFQSKTESSGTVFWFMLVATILLLPGIFIYGYGNLFYIQEYSLFSLNIEIPVLIWVLCLGIISTGVAYFFMSFALKRIKASIYSLIDVIVSPLVASLFGFFFLSEVPSSSMIWGGSLLLLSGYWLTTYLSKGKLSSLELFQYHFEKVKKHLRKKVY